MQWALDGELIVGTVLACCRAWVFTLNYWYLNRWKNQLYLTLHDALLTVCLLHYHRCATPQRFPDDCVSVFDPEACEYVVHKKDETTIRCPVFSAVLKWFVFYGVLEVWRWAFHINDAFHITFVPFFKMPVSRFRFLNKNSYETNSQVTFSAQASQPSVPQAEIWQSVTHQITDVGIIKGKTHHYYTLGEFSSTFALLEYLLVNISEY